MKKNVIELDEKTKDFYKQMTLSRVADIAYKKYKVKWFLDHDYSLEEIFEVILHSARNEILDNVEAYDNGFLTKEDVANLSEKKAIQNFEEYPLYEECYVCKDEFLQNEFLDKEYVKELLDDWDYNQYLTIMEGDNV